MKSGSGPTRFWRRLITRISFDVQLLGGLFVAVLIRESGIPRRRAPQSFTEPGARLPVEMFAGLGNLSEPVGEIPSASGHGEDWLSFDSKLLGGRRGHIRECRFFAARNIEGFAIKRWREFQRGVEKGLAGVLHVDEVAGRFGIRQRRKAFFQSMADHNRDQ